MSLKPLLFSVFLIQAVAIAAFLMAVVCPLNSEAADSMVRYQITQYGRIDDFGDTVHVRETDVFGRLGGEEFLLVLPETYADEAAQIAEKLRQDISQIKLDSVGGVTCSMGVSQYKAGEGCSGFMKRVDTAMYRAKSAGRNKVVVEIV